MRIGLPSTAPASAQKLQVPAASSGDAFQAALKSSSLPRVWDGAKTAAAAKPNATATLTARSGGKQQRTQAAAASTNSAATTVTAPPANQVDQQTATTDEIASGQAAGGRGGQSDCSSAGEVTSQTSAATLNLHASAVEQSEVQQSSGSRPAIALTEEATARQTEVNSAQPLDPAVDAQTTAATTTPSTVARAIDPTTAIVVAQAPGDAVVLPATLPLAGAPGGKAGNQLPSKPTQKNAAGPVEPKSLDLTNAADAQKSKPTEAANGTTDPAQQHSQGNGQSGQHSQADAAQPAAMMSKPSDGSVTQMQTVTVHSVASAPGSAVASPDAASATHGVRPHADAAVLASAGDELAPASGLNTAKVLQTMSQTEMRVGMHSADFGNISIRASVSQQQMVARISLDHYDLGQAISAHTTAVQAKLGDDFGMNATIEVNHQGAPLGGGGDAQQREQRDFSRSVATSTMVAAQTEISLGHAALVSAGDGPRLDIRA